MEMEEYTVTFKYDPAKLTEVEAGSSKYLLTETPTKRTRNSTGSIGSTSNSNGEDSSSQDSPSKIVSFHYNKSALNSFSSLENDLDNHSGVAPTTRSIQRHRSRTPTPPSPTSRDERLQPPFNNTAFKHEVLLQSQSQPSPQDEETCRVEQLRKRTYRDLIESMKNYHNSIAKGGALAHDVETLWYYDLQNISQRLHYLREVYKTIQTLKKRKPNKTDLVSEPHSSNVATPMGLEDELLAPRHSQTYPEEEGYSSNDTDNSMTPNNRRRSQNSQDDTPMGKRMSRRRVQFQS